MNTNKNITEKKSDEIVFTCQACHKILKKNYKHCDKCMSVLNCKCGVINLPYFEHINSNEHSEMLSNDLDYGIDFENT